MHAWALRNQQTSIVYVFPQVAETFTLCCRTDRKVRLIMKLLLFFIPNPAVRLIFSELFDLYCDRKCIGYYCVYTY